MSKKKRPTAADARATFSYDPDTGILTRKTYLDKRGQPFTRGAGRIITPTAQKYTLVKLRGTPYPIHRVVYLLMTGRWPRVDIDHVNGDRKDNRWSNLRLASRSQNCANRGPAPTNRSGYKGVSLCANTGLWRARIKYQGKQTCLGRFTTPIEAHAAYAAAATRIHGEYARIA